MFLEIDVNTGEWFITANTKRLSQHMSENNLDRMANMNAAQILGSLHRDPLLEVEKDTLLKIIAEEGGGTKPLEELKQSLQINGFPRRPP